jgi:hypothetical protein
VGTPLLPGWAFISSGTWSLVGVERATPLLTPEAEAANFTNEGGAGGTIRFLKNVMGLWVLESCRREWGSAAPDIDADTFRRDLAPRLIAAAHGATMYASSTDEALSVSHHYNGEARAGDLAAGPIVVTGMETIDVSAVDPGPLGHSYIGDSPSVLDDVAKLLDDGMRAAARLGNPVSGPLGSYWRIASLPPGGGTH